MADSHHLLVGHYYYTIVVVVSTLFIVHEATLGASLSFNLDFSTSDYASELSYGNDAHWANPVIELTKDGNGSVGRVSYARPLPLWDPTTGELASFTTNFSFQIKPSDNCGWMGDGMAFFLSYYPSVTPTNSDGGGLGLITRMNNSYASGDEQFVAVEFDTFRNFFDYEASADHIGIDINSIVSNVSKDTDDWPGKNLSSGLPMAAQVSYRNDTKVLSVDLQIDIASYHLSTPVDLRDYMPQLVAVGFSAATGATCELHRLLSWSFESSDLGVKDNKLPAITDRSKPPAVAAAAAVPSSAPRTTRTQEATTPTNKGGLPPSQATTTHEDEAPTKSGNRAERHALILVSGLLCLTVLATFTSKTFRWWRKLSGKERLGCCGPRQYQYCELVKATNGFDERRKLGRGGSGEVYHGQDNDGRQIAVKRLIPTGTGVAGGGEQAAQRIRLEFETEVIIISRIRHMNLVRLIGWCDSSNGLLLVYQFISGGSLEKHLYPNRRQASLTWSDRFRVIIGLAKAMCYLHGEHSGNRYVLHGDIKPSNIMLDVDENLNAKLGDFGLARLVDHGTEPRTTQTVMGTPCYIEEEFRNTGKYCRASDLYSFGVVLLEMVTGRQPTDHLFPAWVWDELYDRNRVGAAEGAGSAALQQRFADSSDRQMQRVLVVGLWCTQQARSERPSMAQALRVLEHADSPLPVLRRPRPCNDGRLTATALSAVTEPSAAQGEHPVSISAGGELEMALVPSRMYPITAPVVATAGGEQQAWSGTQPSSTSISFTTCPNLFGVESVDQIKLQSGGINMPDT